MSDKSAYKAEPWAMFKAGVDIGSMLAGIFVGFLVPLAPAIGLGFALFYLVTKVAFQ
jgi:hypothetical protein